MNSLKFLFFFLSVILLITFQSSIVSATLEKGETAPELNGIDQKGTSINLEYYKQNNILLYFLKYLDDPSRRDLLTLNKFKTDTPQAFFNVIIIQATQQGYDDTLLYLKEKNIDFPLLLDQEQNIQLLYKIDRQFPTMYIVDKEGKILSQRVGFMRPLDDFLKQFMKDVGQDIKYTPVESGKPWLGLLIIKIPDYLKQLYGIEKGLYIGKVIPNSPAQKAGLQTGDTILEFGDKAVEDEDDVKNLIENKKAGEAFNVVFIRRKASSLTLSLMLDASKSAGWKLGNMPDALQDLYGCKDGLIIEEITKNGLAEKYGFKPFDLLVSTEKTTLEEKEQVEKIIAAKSAGDQVGFSVIRLTNETLKTKVSIGIK